LFAPYFVHIFTTTRDAPAAWQLPSVSRIVFVVTPLSRDEMQLRKNRRGVKWAMIWVLEVVAGHTKRAARREPCTPLWHLP